MSYRSGDYGIDQIFLPVPLINSPPHDSLPQTLWSAAGLISHDTPPPNITSLPDGSLTRNPSVFPFICHCAAFHVFLFN